MPERFDMAFVAKTKLTAAITGTLAGAIASGRIKSMTTTTTTTKI